MTSSFARKRVSKRLPSQRGSRVKLILLAAAATAISAPLQAASFDCSRARTPDELAICSDPQLSEMDDLVTAAFNQAKREAAGTVVPLARDLLTDRRTCRANKACILGNQVAAIEAFRNLGARVPPPVGRVPSF